MIKSSGKIFMPRNFPQESILYLNLTFIFCPKLYVLYQCIYIMLHSTSTSSNKKKIEKKNVHSVKRYETE